MKAQTECKMKNLIGCEVYKLSKSNALQRLLIFQGKYLSPELKCNIVLIFFFDSSFIMLSVILNSITRPEELAALYQYKFAPKTDAQIRLQQTLAKDASKKRCYDFLNMVIMKH